jgi:hypothetical protein
MLVICRSNFSRLKRTQDLNLETTVDAKQGLQGNATLPTRSLCPQQVGKEGGSIKGQQQVTTLMASSQHALETYNAFRPMERTARVSLTSQNGTMVRRLQHTKEDVFQYLLISLSTNGVEVWFSSFSHSSF